MLSPLLILLYLVVLITVVVIIVNTTSSSKALAYLMLVILFPVVGLIIYFAIGRNYRVNKIYSKKLEVDKNAFPELDKNLEEHSDSTLEKVGPELGNYYNLAKFNHVDHIISENNDLKLLINGEVKFPDLMNALKEATDHIHIEYYIYEEDIIGNQIADILCQKAREGVKVRFIYDDLGSKALKKRFINNLRDNGVEVFPFYKIWLSIFGNRMNYRNHRKIIVIDGLLGYIGGINISERYTNPNSFGKYWRDTHLKIKGSAVLSLQKVFLADWNFCAEQSLSVDKKFFPLKKILGTKGGQLVQIIHSGPDSDHPDIMYSMVQAIILAKREILITTPYFIPDTSFLDAIKIACLSKVDVKLLVPYVSDNIFVNITSSSYYQELLEIGAEIYRYEKGFVHAKTLVCDGYLATVGTANLDQRSFELNFEINAMVYDHKLADQLRKSFFNDLDVSKKMDLESWKRRPLYIKFFEKVMRLVSPLM